MTKIVVGRSLNDTDVLWRYMSLDKFIDLVESQTLYFAPLSTYEKTDPFEGYVPRAAMQAIADVSRGFRDQHLQEIDELGHHLFSTVAPEAAHHLKAELQRLREKAESQLPTMGAVVVRLVPRQLSSTATRGGLRLRQSDGEGLKHLAIHLKKLTIPESSLPWS